MILFLATIAALYMATCIIPQGLFGMQVAYRRRGPLHTDETGMPMDC